MRYIRGKMDRQQTNLLPMSFDEMIGENNPVRVIDGFVEMLDMEALACQHASTKATGRKPYSPKDMLKLYIYGYFNSIRTSRKLENECHRNIELMWLLNNLAPDFKTIADFRKYNKKSVVGAFKQFSALCDELNLIGKEMVAIDGSKFRACNGRRQNFTPRKIEKMIEHYEQSANRYMEILDSADSTESTENEIDLSNVKEKLKQAMKRLDEIAVLQKEVLEKGEVSKTGPDARHMSTSNNGTDISHNVQIAVDSKHHLVVAIDVTSNAADNGQLYPMAEKAKQELGVDSITVLADKGYYNGECLKSCEENGIKAIVSKQKFGNRTGDARFAKDKFHYDKEKDIYICPMGKALRKTSTAKAKRAKYFCKECKTCPNKENCTTSPKGRAISPNEYVEYHERADKLFAENMELYKQRQMIVEHPFGTIKRALGYTYFLQRGNENVKSESHMHFLIYNMKRVINILGITVLLDVINGKIKENMQIKEGIFCYIFGFLLKMQKTNA